MRRNETLRRILITRNICADESISSHGFTKCMRRAELCLRDAFNLKYRYAFAYILGRICIFRRPFLRTTGSSQPLTDAR